MAPPAPVALPAVGGPRHQRRPSVVAPGDPRRVVTPRPAERRPGSSGSPVNPKAQRASAQTVGKPAASKPATSKPAESTPRPASSTNAFTARRIAANSIANMMQTLASFIIGFVVPPFLIRWIPKNAYQAFLLTSRLGAFLMVLDLGVQLSLQRILSHELATGDLRRTHQVVRAAVALFRRIAIGGVAVLSLLAYLLPRVFTEISPAIVNQARIALLIFGGSSLLVLLLTPFSGLLVAANQSPLVLWRTIVLRVGSAVGMLVAAKGGMSIVVLAGISSGASVGVALLPYFMGRRLFPWLRKRGGPVERHISRLLIREAGLLGIITMTGFLLNQLDLLIVAKVAFKGLIAYSTCVAVVTGLETLHSGLMQPMLPALSAGRATKSRQAYARQFRLSARMVAALWATMTVGTFVIAPFLMRFWVGSALGNEATPILRIVLIGYFFRYGDWAFGVSVVAAGEFKRIMGGPLFGSVFHLLCTGLLGARFGTMGVAVGTAVAAVSTMIFVRFVSMPRVRGIVPVRPNRYFVDSLLVPSVVASPFLAAALLLPSTGSAWFVITLLLGTSGALAVAIATLRLPVSQLRNPRALLALIAKPS